MCAHCGNTWSKERHEALCVTYGLDRREPEKPEPVPKLRKKTRKEKAAAKAQKKMLRFRVGKSKYG